MSADRFFMASADKPPDTLATSEASIFPKPKRLTALANAAKLSIQEPLRGNLYEGFCWGWIGQPTLPPDSTVSRGRAGQHSTVSASEAPPDEKGSNR